MRIHPMSRVLVAQADAKGYNIFFRYCRADIKVLSDKGRAVHDSCKSANEYEVHVVEEKGFKECFEVLHECALLH